MIPHVLYQVLSMTSSDIEIVVKHLFVMNSPTVYDVYSITLFDFASKNSELITTPSLKDLLIRRAINISENSVCVDVVNSAKQLLIQFGIDAKKYLFIQTAQRLGAVCAIECPDENYEDYLLQKRYDRNKTELEMMEAYLRGELYGWYSPLEDRIQLMKKILKKKGIPFHYRLMAQYFKWVKTCDGGNRYVKMKAFVYTL